MSRNDEWLEKYQKDLTTSPVCSKELILQWIDFYKASALPEEIKIPLFQIIQEGALMGAPFSDRVSMAMGISPNLEKIIGMGLWDDVLKLLYLSYTVCQGISEGERRQKNREQTKKACAENQQKMLDRIMPFEEYLQEVERLWHPNGAVANERFPQHSKQKSIEKVFHCRKDVIIQKIKEMGIEKRNDTEYKNYFGTLFAEYTNEYRKRNNGITVSGFKLETRRERVSTKKRKKKK